MKSISVCETVYDIFVAFELSYNNANKATFVDVMDGV